MGYKQVTGGQIGKLGEVGGGAGWSRWVTGGQIWIVGEVGGGGGGRAGCLEPRCSRWCRTQTRMTGTPATMIAINVDTYQNLK